MAVKAVNKIKILAVNAKIESRADGRVHSSLYGLYHITPDSAIDKRFTILKNRIEDLAPSSDDFRLVQYLGKIRRLKWFSQQLKELNGGHYPADIKEKILDVYLDAKKQFGPRLLQ